MLHSTDYKWFVFFSKLHNASKTHGLLLPLLKRVLGKWYYDAGDVFSASEAISPERFEQPE